VGTNGNGYVKKDFRFKADRKISGGAFFGGFYFQVFAGMTSGSSRMNLQDNAYFLFKIFHQS
jgi:hypothetical protein